MRTGFEISSGEGLPIRGVLEVPPQPRCVVVIVHGFKGFKDWGFFPWISERLTAAGIATIRFDMSRSGIGGRPGELDRLDLFADDTYATEVADLAAVLAWSRGIDRFHGLPRFLLGHSRGGGVAVLAAAREAVGIRGLVTWSSIARADRWSAEEKKAWRASSRLEVVNARTGQRMPLSTRILDEVERGEPALDIAAAMASLPCPTLTIHGFADESVPVSEARELARHARNGSLVLIENAGHTFGAQHPMDGVPPELSFAMHATIGFLGAYCRQTRIVTRD
ncbi:MAG: alpha/beta hydrolase family protein [Thermoanaerobaculia bacterium]